MAFNTQTPIANGDGYEDVKSRLVTLAETWLGAGQASGGNVPSTWADMRTKLNLILTAFGKTNIANADSGLSVRNKINGIIDAETLLTGTLLAWWNADRSDLISLSGSQVTSWRDSLFAYDMTQATSAARPSYSATGFNGSPGLTFDGSDDCLAMASQPFPAGSSASELWAVAQNDAPATDTATRRFFAYGDTTNDSRALVRSADGVSVITTVMNTGTGATVIGGSRAGLTARHLLRGIVTPTTTQVVLDGVAGTAQAAVSATSTVRARIGASPGTTPVGYCQGKIRDIIVAGGLTTDQATYLTNFLLTRRSL